jgi:hypothetical protein
MLIAEFKNSVTGNASVLIHDLLIISSIRNIQKIRYCYVSSAFHERIICLYMYEALLVITPYLNSL